MLLESALLDFSTQESEVFEDAVQHSGVGFDWDTLGKSKFLSKNGGSGSNSDVAAGPAEIKHVYLDRKLPRSRQPSGEFSAVRQSKALSDFLGMSRSPPAVDVNCGPSFEISRADEDAVHDDGRSIGKEAHPGSFKTSINGRPPKSAADVNNLHDNMSLAGNAGAVSFAREAQPRKPKLQQRGTSPNRTQQLQITPNRAISIFKNGKGVSPSSASSQKKEYKDGKEQLQQQQGRPSSSPKARGVSPIRQTTGKVRSFSGDGKQVKRPDSMNSPEVHRRLENHRIRRDDNFANSRSSKYKYYEEESPVSTLERPPSPPTTNSSVSSGPSVHSPPRPAPAAPQPGVALARRRPPSFSSPSENVSPRASTSSSTRYMGQCLVALQAALAIDPEKSKRFEDSFVELDTFVAGDESLAYAKSPIHDDDDEDDLFNRKEQGRCNLTWARGAAVSRFDLEPEYNTVDFYTDSDEERVDQQSRISPSSSVASIDRSSSGSSISRPIRRSLNSHRPMSVEEYSLKDKRFLSSHPSSWVEHGDDSISSSLTNSKCNTLTRHQDIPWDEQQADLDLVRAEEVIRGAIDGLRFTYSPVSSAFVFTRSNEGDEEGAASSRKGNSGYSPHDKTFTDSEASRRFSISLDYGASVRSEDTMSFARASDVTELGMSRAESWSKVARGITSQQGYQDAIPSSFIRRAGYAPMFEEANGSSCSPAFNPSGGLGDGTPDSRIVRKRLAKKSGMTTCLPFRAILRNFRTLGSPARPRLGVRPNDGDRPAVNRLTY